MSEEKAPTIRSDGYDDIFNRRSGSENMGAIISRTDRVEEFYIADPIARRIVDVIPEEMVTPGFGLDGIADEKAFSSQWDGMKLNEQIIEAFCWERLFGGAAVVAIINDGRSLKTPARPGAKLEGIRVYEKSQVKIGKRETNPRKANYGEPVTYTISSGTEAEPYEIHVSRCYILGGARVSQQKRKQNGGWGVSVLSPRLIDSILDYNYCEELATQLLRRKQQAVWKAKNLHLLCDDDEGEYAARVRLAQVDDNSGVGRAVGVDADHEDYNVLNSDITGVDAFLDKKMDRIVTYSGIHEIILKNRNVGGVSASQNTALETFYKAVNRLRNSKYRPLLEWLIPFIIDEQEWSIRWEPLSVPSEKEQAETFAKYAEGVSKLVNDEMIDADEGRDTMQAVFDMLKLKPGNVPSPDDDTDDDPEIDNQGGE